jgi:hypothetical protein
VGRPRTLGWGSSPVLWPQPLSTSTAASRRNGRSGTSRSTRRAGAARASSASEDSGFRKNRGPRASALNGVFRGSPRENALGPNGLRDRPPKGRRESTHDARLLPPLGFVLLRTSYCSICRPVSISRARGQGEVEHRQATPAPLAGAVAQCLSPCAWAGLLSP